MSDIRTLLDEYVSITGRPIQTISVDEYLSFKKFADKAGVQKIREEAPVTEKETTMPQKEQEVESSKKKTEPAMIRNYPVQQKSCTEKRTAMEKKNSENTMLSLLNSIPG